MKILILKSMIGVVILERMRVYDVPITLAQALINSNCACEFGFISEMQQGADK